MKARQLLCSSILSLGFVLALLRVLGGAAPSPVHAALPALSTTEETAMDDADRTRRPHRPYHVRAGDVLTVCPAAAGTCPYTNVQAAVDAAGYGDVIKVAAGVYTGVQNRPAPPGYPGPPANGLVAQVVYVSKSITIQGGYTTTNDFAGPPDPEANPTTLDARGQGRVIYVTGDISPTIEGLRITGGDSAELGGGQWNGEAGGGVYVITATVTLSGCRVVANTANRFIPYGGDGGGVYLRNSPNAALTGNTIQSNTAWYGGGVYLHSSDNVTLSGNTIRGNRAHGWYGASGGGVLLEDSGNTTLTGNTIQDNTAQVGGGVFSHGSDNTTLSGNTIISNADGGSHTFFEGGGICLWYSDNATLSGNTIQGNSGEEGGGICLRDSDNATLSGNTIRGNLGSGVNIWTSDNVMLDNNVIADNQSWAGGGINVAGSTAHLRHTTLARNGDGTGLYVTDSWDGGAHSTVALTNTVLVSHTVGVSATAGNTVTLNGILWYGNDVDISGPGTLTITHQITGDPAFAADGCHITPASAALDAGMETRTTVDIDGEPRPVGAGFDIGADEFPAALSVSKYASPDLVEPGARLTYTVRVTNAGNVDLHATITDTLPAHVVLDQTSGGTLALPGGTVALPHGAVAVTWTAIITAPGGLWNGTLVVTVAQDYAGPLTNLVQVTTKEGARGIYTETSTVISGHSIYLPLVLRHWPSTPSVPPMIRMSGRVTLEDGTGLADVGIYCDASGGRGEPAG